MLPAWESVGFSFRNVVQSEMISFGSPPRSYRRSPRFLYGGGLLGVELDREPVHLLHELRVRAAAESSANPIVNAAIA